ncbi:MAG: walK [Actinomycetia bacterium]|nr:walK [Actinomycetes bacterium]
MLADPDRLLALNGLLDNAFRHTAQGDAIELPAVRGEPGLPVRPIVADSGTGIPEDQLPLIFDRFRTGRGSHPRGLGLGLVHAVARAHGGDVTVRSTLGEGSELALILPAPRASRVAAAPTGQHAAREQDPDERPGRHSRDST